MVSVTSFAKIEAVIRRHLPDADPIYCRPQKCVRYEVPYSIENRAKLRAISEELLRDCDIDPAEHRDIVLEPGDKRILKVVMPYVLGE
jgi:hypothetical protein